MAHPHPRHPHIPYRIPDGARHNVQPLPPHVRGGNDALAAVPAGLENREIIEISDDEDELQVLNSAPGSYSSTHEHRPREDWAAPPVLQRDTGKPVINPRWAQTHKRMRSANGSLSPSGPAVPQPPGTRQHTAGSPELDQNERLNNQNHGVLGFQRPPAYGLPLGTQSSGPRPHPFMNFPKLPSRKESEELPPYYADGKLEAKMYRGAGFERFPVVLGTVAGHQELCDKWDADQLRKLEKKAAKLRKARMTPYVVHDSGSESGEDSDGEAKATLEKECLTSVREVFPDISHDFVREKVRSRKNHGNDGSRYYDAQDTPSSEDTPSPEATRLAQTIIAEILEMVNYPKERPADSLATGNAAAADGTGITISWNRDIPKNDVYLKDAIILLAKHFVHVPTDFIYSAARRKNSIFETFVHIQDVEDQYYALTVRPYHRLRQARTTVEPAYQFTSGDRRILMEHASRVNELQAAKQHVAREAIREAARKAKEEVEALNLASHIKSGAIIVCSCCFDDQVPLNRIVPCLAATPHFFCHVCVKNLADSQIGLLRYEMQCMDLDGCPFDLVHEDIGKAVPITTFDRLELNRQQAEVMAAKIEGLEQCPFCNYKAICDDVDTEPVFECQNPECCRTTCRKCRKDSHLPKTCEEYEREGTLSARHLVEEARSEAIMRPCPKCGVKIIKDFGCNKMICSGCGCYLCYVCKADLTPLGQDFYNHFNRRGATCSLYDQEGVNRHEEEANKAEQEAVQKAKENNANLDESELRIETSNDPKPEDHPAANVFLRDVNNRAGRLNLRQRQVQDMMAHVARLEELRPDPELERIMAEMRDIGEKLYRRR